MSVGALKEGTKQYSDIQIRLMLAMLPPPCGGKSPASGRDRDNPRIGRRSQTSFTIPAGGADARLAGGNGSSCLLAGRIREELVAASRARVPHVNDALEGRCRVRGVTCLTSFQAPPTASGRVHAARSIWGAKTGATGRRRGEL